MPNNWGLHYRHDLVKGRTNVAPFQWPQQRSSAQSQCFIQQDDYFGNSITTAFILSSIFIALGNVWVLCFVVICASFNPVGLFFFVRYEVASQHLHPPHDLVGSNTGPIRLCSTHLHSHMQLLCNFRVAVNIWFCIAFETCSVFVLNNP